MGPTKHGVPIADYERVLDGLRHAAAVVAQAQCDLAVYPADWPGASRLGRHAVKKADDVLAETLAALAAAPDAYSDGSAVVVRTRDPLEGLEVAQVLPPPRAGDAQ
jgi:hypothetical protein